MFYVIVIRASTVVSFLSVCASNCLGAIAPENVEGIEFIYRGPCSAIFTRVKL